MKNLIIPKFQTTNSFTEFIENWSPLYTDSIKDDVYYYPAINSVKQTPELLQGYFVWKNGMKLSEKKQTSFENKILSKIEIINNLKGDCNDLNLIKDNFEDVSTIWLITLAHLINPVVFPVFDIHVFRAFQYISTKGIDLELISTENRKLNTYIEGYLPFFNSLKDENLNPKRMDAALWSFGKFLSLYPSFFR
jgi:hypothetical protein